MAAHTEKALKISTLVERSGVSKELIHHYLREGLLPRPATRARYSAAHLRLLLFIKRLRDERFLPLPVIRELFAFNDYDPDRIELVLLSGAEPSGPGASLPDGEAISSEELCERGAISRDTLQDYLDLGLLRASGANRSPHFHRHDLNIVSLLQRGTQMGIPLTSFRTIRSYIELGFELEQDLFLPPKLARRDLGDLAREFSARKEVVTGFVVNVLTGLVNGLLYGFLEDAVERARAVDESVYTPSDAFVRKHEVDHQMDQLRKRIGQHPDDVASLVRLARLFLLCGRYREAIFVADQARALASADRHVLALLGRALVLHGQVQRGIDVLSSDPSPPPVALAYLAAAKFTRLTETGNVEATLRGAQRVVQLALDAVDAAKTGPPIEQVEVRLAAGWILTSLSGARHLQSRGVEMIEQVFDLCAPTGEALEPEVERIRGRITSAYLLHRCSDCWRLDPERVEARRRALCDEVFRMDPGCEMARRLFLSASSTRGQSP